MRFIPLIAIGTVIAVAAPPPARAGETIAYTYDAKGRLTKVVRSGTVNAGVATSYTHDKADNRRALKTTGSPNPPPP